MPLPRDHLSSPRLNLGRLVILGAATLMALSAVGCNEEEPARSGSEADSPGVPNEAPGSRTEGESTLAPCEPTQLRITTVGGAELSGGSVFIGVQIEQGRYAPCLLRGPMTVALRDSAGRLLPVGGNPLRREIAFRMSRRSSVSADMTWSGWCGPQQHVELKAVVAGVGDRAIIRPPLCGPDMSRSSLRPLRQAGWLYAAGGATEIER